MTSITTHRVRAVAATLAVLAAVPAVGRAQTSCQGEPSGAKLHMVVEGLRSDKGVMTATIYGDDPAKFLKKDGDLQVWRADAHMPTMDMCFWLPGPSVYAVVLYHDTKRVYHFTRGTFGPTQDYGFSRNPTIFFAPPSLAATRFEAKAGDTTIHIRLKRAF